MCVFSLPVYLLLGLVCVLVVVETCCELPQLRRFRQRFYQETVRELDSETTHIIDQDHMSDQLTEHSEHVANQLPVIPSVSEQAASLRQESKSVPYTPASGSAVNKKQWWEIVYHILKDLFVNFCPICIHCSGYTSTGCYASKCAQHVWVDSISSQTMSLCISTSKLSDFIT